MYGADIELDILEKNFNKSYQMTKQNLINTGFENFEFVLENYKNIGFLILQYIQQLIYYICYQNKYILKYVGIIIKLL